MTVSNQEHLLLVPTGHGVGLTTVSLGLVRAFEREGVRLAFCKPIAQPRPGYEGPERSTSLIRATTPLDPPEPLSLADAEEALRKGAIEDLLEQVVEKVTHADPAAEVIVVEGLVPSDEVPFASDLNEQVATALDADVVLVGAPGASPAECVDAFRLAAKVYGDRVKGCILNKVERPEESADAPPLSSSFIPGVDATRLARRQDPFACALEENGFKCVGAIPKRDMLAAPRVKDVARALRAEVLNEGDLGRRTLRFRVAAMMVPHCLGVLEPGALVVTPGDRNDVIMATSLAALRGVPLAGLLLTSGVAPDRQVMRLCSRALELGLPVLQVKTTTIDTANALLGMDREVPIDDVDRIEMVMTTVADCLDRSWVEEMRANERPHRLSPPAFRHRLIEEARAAGKRIVLPEGTEPRTLRAAVICQERGIARCVVLGDPTAIRHAAADSGLDLPRNLEIVDPKDVIERYVGPLVERRRHKGLTHDEARGALHDEVVLGTAMLMEDHVDGLVSGAIHTTADTVRPALQLIKTAPGTKLVSSIFFMCLRDQVLVYGDCAINPDPNAEQLADIAIQSAASAEAFGIEPRVALISYSTGTSGAGADVAKVSEATELARKARPDLPIDGPLQYDAAVMPSVAAKKAPNSPVAGQASVLVFPDLNTGNTTYKAVQRSANVVSMGPMLQGLAKPVNDLSRGALVDDIVYTIALTAIQAAARK